MKVVIIADIHDNLINLKNCLDWCKENNVIHLICCGDVTNNETLDFMSANISGTVHLVKGNVDSWQDKDCDRYANVKYYGRSGGVAEFSGRIIGFCHEAYLLDKVLEKGNPEIVFYGHSHKPWQEDKSGVVFVNPGTLGGMFLDGTFAVFDVITGELFLKRAS